MSICPSSSTMCSISLSSSIEMMELILCRFNTLTCYFHSHMMCYSHKWCLELLHTQLQSGQRSHLVKLGWYSISLSRLSLVRKPALLIVICLCLHWLHYVLVSCLMHPWPCIKWDMEPSAVRSSPSQGPLLHPVTQFASSWSVTVL